MKKIFLLISFCLCLSLAHAEMGIGVKYGTGPADSNINLSSVDENKSFYGFEVFFEKDAEKDALGLRIGFNKYGDITGKDFFDIRDPWGVPTGQIGHMKLENEFYSIPVTVYYKYKFTPAIHAWFGGGVTWAYSKWSYSYDDYSYAESGTANDNKFFPHVDLGAEWRINKDFGIGLDLTYNSKSKVDTEDLYRGVEGVTGNLVARVYF